MTMSFMKPVAEFMEALIVETNRGTQVIPGNIITEEDMNLFSEADGELNEDIQEAILEYCEGNKVFSFEVSEGWYSRLSAEGFLDATDWMGPYNTEEKAGKAIMEFYEVDENGDPTEDF
jgi:hypothetical protein